MMYLRGTQLCGILVAAFLATACGSESITGPATSEITPEFDGSVQGVVTSGADARPLVGARVTVVRWINSSCHGIGCSDGWGVVEETVTSEDGSYSLPFHCTGSGSVNMRVAGPGEGIGFFGPILGAQFRVAHTDISCQGAPQRHDFTLEPLGPTALVNLRAYLDAILTVTARSKWGLTSVSIDWGDRSPVEVTAISGEVQSVEFPHKYSEPGSYTMRVVVSDSLGQTKTSSWLAAIGIGWIEVRTMTVGSFDPAGSYLVRVSGGDWKSIPVRGIVTFENQVDGNVELADIPDNCSVSEQNPSPVKIFGGATNVVSFSVSCT